MKTYSGAPLHCLHDKMTEASAIQDQEHVSIPHLLSAPVEWQAALRFIEAPDTSQQIEGCTLPQERNTRIANVIESIVVVVALQKTLNYASQSLPPRRIICDPRGMHKQADACANHPTISHEAARASDSQGASLHSTP